VTRTRKKLEGGGWRQRGEDVGPPRTKGLQMNSGGRNLGCKKSPYGTVEMSAKRGGKWGQNWETEKGVPLEREGPRRGEKG